MLSESSWLNVEMYCINAIQFIVFFYLNRKVACNNQGIINPTGTETRQIFSHLFVIATIFQELFTPI